MLLLFIIFILFVFLYEHSKERCIIFLIAYILIGKFVLMKLGYYYAPTIYNVSSIAILYMSIRENIWCKHNKMVWVCAILYIFYFGVVPLLVWGSNLNACLDSLISYKNIFIYFLLGLIVIKKLKNKCFNSTKIKKTILYFGLFEAILVILQFLIPSISDFFWIRTYLYKGKTIDLLDASFDNISQHVCTGTLLSTAHISLFLSVMIIIFLCIKQKEKWSKNSYIYFFTIILSLLLVGVRAPFISSVIILLFYSIYIKRLTKKILFSYVIIGFIFITSLARLATVGTSLYSDADRSNPISRALSGIVIFSDKKNLKNTTISLSMFTMPYFLKSPVWGNGNHAAGKGYSIFSGIKVEDYSTTDAGIIFVLAEYGIIGFIILLLPIFIIYRHFTHPITKKLYIILVISILLNSIVDLAINNDQVLILLFLFPLWIYHLKYKGVLTSCNIEKK